MSVLIPLQAGFTAVVVVMKYVRLYPSVVVHVKQQVLVSYVQTGFDSGPRFQLSAVCCDYCQFFQGNHSFIPSYAIFTAQKAMSNKLTYEDIFTHRLNETMRHQSSFYSPNDAQVKCLKTFNINGSVHRSMIQQKQPTRCSLLTEFIIPPFIKCSTCFERYAAHHQEL